MAQQVNHTSPADTPEFMRERTILQTKLPVSITTWRYGVKSGKFPKGIKISERVTIWRTSDIDAFIQSLA
jgi:predicted DNA-binding transcriptional regulator AlpA